MAKYISFFTYTPEAWKAMTDSPEDRTAAVVKIVESVGGKLESFYWMSGSHDGFLIYDVADDASAAALAAVVKGSGALKDYATHALVSMPQAHAILKKAHDATRNYRPPGR